MWSDPLQLDACVHEFKDDNERFLESAEKIMDAPYDWESWHGVILPPSFPYGGMENPSVPSQ